METSRMIDEEFVTVQSLETLVDERIWGAFYKRNPETKDSVIYSSWDENGTQIDQRFEVTISVKEIPVD